MNFYHFDKDGNTRLDPGECAGTKTPFGEIDLDRNGFITIPEIRDYDLKKVQMGNGTPAQFFFDSWDRNRDGIVTSLEFPYNPGLFSYFTAGKGTLTREDFISSYDYYRQIISQVSADEFGWITLIDRNADSLLSETDLLDKNQWKDLINQYDLNKDSIITKYEVKQASLSPHYWQPIIAARNALNNFSDQDNNKDEFLSSDELGISAYLIHHLDRDADSLLNKEELGIINKLAEEGPEAYNRYRYMLRFRQLDENEDNYLSFEELKNYQWLFNSLDVNSDNRIDLKEFQNIEYVMKSLLLPVQLSMYTDSIK